MDLFLFAHIFHYLLLTECLDVLRCGIGCTSPFYSLTVSYDALFSYCGFFHL